MNSHLPRMFRLSKSLLLIASVASVYLLLWRSVTHWSGKWPAPYWFAVGLGVLLACGLLTTRMKHLAWSILFACFAVYASWFFSSGIYQRWAKTSLGRWWAHLDDWEQNFPTLLLMALFVVSLLFIRAIDRGWRFHLSISLFLFTFFIMSFFANIVCSIYLPPDGWFGAFDHDILGFGLGGYYLVMVALSVLLLKIIATKLHVIAPNKSLQPGSGSSSAARFTSHGPAC